MARDQRDKPGPPEGHAYGAASVTNVLQGAAFPCTKQDLMEVYGDRQIFWTKDHPEKLQELLRRIPQDHFNSMADVVHGIGQMNREGMRSR